MKWDLNSLQNNTKFLVGHGRNKRQSILWQTAALNNISVKVPFYGTHDDPNQNRISGYLNLVNGNGTLTLNVKNIQYNESGDYVMFAWNLLEKALGKTIYGVAISVKVKGKTGPDSLSVGYIRGCV